MKRTGNQKVVTAAIQKHSSKALSAPYRACTILPDKKLLSMPLQSKIGACGVLLLGLPISNRDIAAGGYPIISGWGLIRSPFAPPKRGKPHIFPRKIGVMSVRAQICSRKIPGTGRAVLCFGNGYSVERLIRKWEGSRQLSQSHYNKRAFGSWILLPNVLY